MHRRLPVYLLVDTSESMIGTTIEAVNNAVRQLVRELQSDPHALETAYVSIITFDHQARQLVPLTEVSDIQIPELAVRPGTALGTALQLLKKCIDTEVRKTTADTRGDYRPLVFLLTDGQPTDDWSKVKDQMFQLTNPRIGNFYAIGFGDDLDYARLREISDIAFRMDDLSSESIRKLFVWLTASVRSASIGTTGGVEEISRGNLELRADINTGDEFEQLSHAFNRMLRHMMTVNDELRTLNTDLDQKFDQLAQVNLQLYETGKLKDEFLATMSHELRTPLNSIIGFSDVLLSGDTLSEKERRYVTTIQTSGNNLLALINDLLDLAKIESGKMQVQPVEFEIEELIERQTTNIQPLAEKKNIELKWDVPPGIPKLLQDFGKMSQILNNLLSNAIKFTPEGGRVRVTGQQLDRQNIELLVEDTGIGIPLDEQETVFEKFRQGNTTPGKRNHTTREYEGTGLGLSIVRELSHLLGGEVSLMSEFGKGSTFKVRLPIEVDISMDDSVDLEADTEVDTRLAAS